MIADATHSQDAGPIVRFALDRVHDAADLLYDHAKETIDRAENAMSEIHVDQLLQRSVPLIRRCVSFMRLYPLRTATMLALVATAALLARAPAAGGKP